MSREKQTKKKNDNRLLKDEKKDEQFKRSVFQNFINPKYWPKEMKKEEDDK